LTNSSQINFSDLETVHLDRIDYSFINPNRIDKRIKTQKKPNELLLYWGGTSDDLMREFFLIFRSEGIKISAVTQI
jgi:hypothetical protein